MSWSWRIARIAGIPIYVHWTFLILILWLLVAGFRAGQPPAETFAEIGFVLALFGCVVLHELGHALMARRFGVKTTDITLLPIGGVARLQRIPEKPSEELLVAIAGPLVNVVIALVLFIGLRVRWTLDLSDEQLLVHGGWATRLLAVNVFLVLFNLIPAFPMDGGRILRSLLAMVMDYGRATRVAATIGQFVAIGFGFFGLYSGNVMLVLIALFVWIGAQGESAAVAERIELRGVKVRQAMLTDFKWLTFESTLGEAADQLLAGSQQDFPIMEQGVVVAVLTRAVLIQGLAEFGRDARMRDVTTLEVRSVDADMPLVSAIVLLREHGMPCLQVLQNGKPVGLLTAENVTEYLMVKSALGEQHAPTIATTSPRVPPAIRS